MERSSRTRKRLARRPLMVFFGFIGILILFGALACNVSQNAPSNSNNDSDNGFGEADFPTSGGSDENDDNDNDGDFVPPLDAPDPRIANPTRPFEAVVQIIALYLEDGEFYYGWSGSGTVITPSGLILTNAHVVLPDRYYNVDALAIAFTSQEDQEPEAMYFAEVLQADAQLDIAVIQIVSDLDGNPVDYADLNLPYVPLGDADELRLGDGITILGYPGIGGNTITLTRGEVSGFTSEEGRGDRAFIKTSATIAGGNSGGLAADADGYLIGVPTQLGYGGDDQYVDCRVLADTNRDGVVDENDNCVPTGGFINALRPINLAMPLIEAAQDGIVHVVGGEEAPPPVSGLPEAGEILFFDDFELYDEYWVWDESYGDIEYDFEELHFELWEPSEFLWRENGHIYEDVIIEVDAYVVNPAGDGDFGVICRFQDDANLYGLEVSEDGYYSIWKIIDNELFYMWEEEWSYLPFELDYANNVHITASCVGNTLTLAVDGELLAEVIDNDLDYGSAGMVAGTWDGANLTIGFDNLIIYSAEN